MQSDRRPPSRHDASIPRGVATAVRRPAASAALLLAALATVALAASVGLLVGCSAVPDVPRRGATGSGTASGEAPATDYSKVEVRDYEGKRLSSIGDEPDNSIKGPQAIDVESFRLVVDGLVTRPLELTYSQVTSMPAEKKVVELHCVEGWTMTYLWEGVALRDLFERAGGTDPSAKVVIFHCVDGYTSSLPLDYALGRNIILGYRMNGVTMPPERGYPFQVVAEDRYGYKWAKWVQRIELSSNVNYLGYWERRGYDNGAKLPGVE